MANSTMADSNSVMLLQFFHEIPNRAAAIAAAVLYIVASLAVLTVTIRTRAWFMLTVVITGLLEALGFAIRAAMVAGHASLKNFIFMQMGLVVSPVLLAVAEYICVGRLMHLSEAGRTFKLARWLAKLYTLSDILCLMLQSAGGGSAGSSDEAARARGLDMLLAGLALQLLFFATFTIVTIYVHLSPRFELRGVNQLRPLFICLYITVALMFVRNIFRLIEFMQGFDGYLASHESFLYIFDFVPLYVCFLLFTVYHYGLYLRRYTAGQKPLTDADADADASEATRNLITAALQQQQQQYQQQQKQQQQHNGEDAV